MPLFSLINLGCSKNIIDGEHIIHLVKRSGYSLTNDLSRADLIIVNTCAFIREAQEEAIENILHAAQAKKSARTRLVVSGCFSERYRKEIHSEFPEVDLWTGVNDWETLLGELLDVSPTPAGRVLSGPRATQHLKIAEGCSHHCSFCVIPSIRGSYRSRTPSSVIEEAQWLQSQGVRELILVAQDSSRYGKDIGLSLSLLLEKIIASTSIPWIRLMYLHPQFISNEFLKLCADEPRICSYFDIPLQHIADSLLISMKRKPLSKGLYHLIEQIRTTAPGAAIRTAFITGYPGETTVHFKKLVQFIEWARFEKLGVFPYSPEEGTPAALLRPRPRNGTAFRRCETLMAVQRDISREINEHKVGTEIDVIIDRIADDPDFNFEARGRFDAPEVDGRVFIRNGSFNPGTITRVTVIGASDYDLFAEVTT